MSIFNPYEQSCFEDQNLRPLTYNYGSITMAPYQNDQVDIFLR